MTSSSVKRRSTAPPTAATTADPGLDAAPGLTADSPAAVAAKAVYVLCRRRWEERATGLPSGYTAPAAYDGQPALTNSSGRRVRPAVASAWAELADRLRAIGAAPEDFIPVPFDALLAAPPEPRQLVNSATIAAYHKELADRPAKVRRILTSDAGTYRLLFNAARAADRSIEEAMVVALADPAAKLSPLFRHCTAAALRAAPGDPLDRLAARAFPDAVVQFARARDAYRAAWAAILPVDFEAAADAALAAAYRGAVARA